MVYRLAQLYAALGGVTAVAFLLMGIDRVSPGAQGAYAFRPLLLPGLILLWPLVLWRWFVLARPGRAAPIALGLHHRRVHRGIWLVLTILLPLLLVLCVALRQEGPLETPPQQLAPAAAP